ncbi:ATP dependent DNA ligase [Nocardia amikacinitolerans]|uniref:ATP dependent DNA ligase n=1 Tax=Nocardia amikacinitolerans TaxID=756689 RepID=UPI0020A4EDBF|nr:hypothetical protein [Nocardia amikacinitolerans]
MLGAHDSEDRLVYVGHVATGFTNLARRTLREQLDQLRRARHPFFRPPPPSRMSARWVEPILVGTVEYREFGSTLRHPSWRGLRPEIHPSKVTVPK